MYMVIFLYLTLNWQVKLRAAGRLEIQSGLVKILKHSARLVLHVIEGSKSISVLFLFAMVFAVFRPGVSEKFSRLKMGLSGFNLGSIWWIRARASWAHWWGLGQPSSLSRAQS